MSSNSNDTKVNNYAEVMALIYMMNSFVKLKMNIEIEVFSVVIPRNLQMLNKC
jgi:hypothetical protein